MTDLLRAVRDFDLPRRWDGLAVVWTPWELDTTLICPPPRPQPCQSCGLIRPRSVSTGWRATHPDITHREVENRAFAPGRTMTPLGHVEPIALMCLTAFRCTDCGHDQVYDSRTEESWDLDWRDYGINGSTT